jgi:hypothetical protein
MNHIKDVTKINLSNEENCIESWCVYADIIKPPEGAPEGQWTVYEVYMYALMSVTSCIDLNLSMVSLFTKSG